MAETGLSGNLKARYLRGAGLLAQVIDGKCFYYLHNAHGDVVQRVSEGGDPTPLYRYDAFGNQREPVETDPNPFRYCGEYFDGETQSVYLRARYYDPGTGRFGQEDSAKDGLNWYTYCVNNPVNCIDPSGCLSLSKKKIDFQRDDLDDSKLNERFGFSTKEEKGILDLLNSLFESFDKEPGYIKNLDFKIPSFSEMTKTNWGFIAGLVDEKGLAEIVELILKQFKIDIAFEMFGDAISPAPFGKNTVTRFAGAINKVNGGANALAVVGLLFDIGNTLTADDGNTIKQRLIKIAVNIVDFFVSKRMGSSAVKIGLAVSGVFGPVVGVAVGALAAIGGTSFKNKGKDWILNQFNIK